MRRADLKRKRSIKKQRDFFNDIMNSICKSERKKSNARLRKGLYKKFFEEFAVLLEYVEIKYSNQDNISFKWVGEDKQNQMINYDGEIYQRGKLIEKVEITCPLISQKDKILAEQLNKRGYSDVEIFDPVEKLNENKEKLELQINAKNSKNTYDGTVTLVAYNNDLLHYIDAKEFNQKYEKDLLDELNSIDYQFKNVYLLENLDVKRLIRIK